MMSDFESVVTLKRYGHLPGVSLYELRSADRFAGDVMNGLTSYQMLNATVGVGAADGVLGPKTERVMGLPRCNHPDAYDEEIANARPADIADALNMDEATAAGLRNMHARMSNVGSGSWPMPCQKAGVLIHVDDRRAPNGLDVDELVSQIVKVYRDVGLALDRTYEPQLAHILLSWRRFWGSTIGLAQYNNERCTDQVTCELSQSYFPNFMQVGELLKHEVGHNNNCPHTNGGTMSSVIRNNITSLAWEQNDPTFPRLVRYHGGQPIDEPGGPEPPPDHKWPATGEGVIQLGDATYDVSLKLRESQAGSTWTVTTALKNLKVD